MTHANLPSTSMPMLVRDPWTHQVTKSNHPAEIKTHNPDPWNHTTEPKPTKSNHLAVKLYLHIDGNTLKVKWISCPVVFGLLSSQSTNLGGEELKPWNREKQKLREREEESGRGERRKKRKIRKKEKKWPFRIKK